MLIHSDDGDCPSRAGASISKSVAEMGSGKRNGIPSIHQRSSAVGMVGTVPTEGDGWAEGRNGPEFSRRRRHGEVTEMPADVNTTRVMADRCLTACELPARFHQCRKQPQGTSSRNGGSTGSYQHVEIISPVFSHPTQKETQQRAGLLSEIEDAWMHVDTLVHTGEEVMGS